MKKKMSSQEPMIFSWLLSVKNDNTTQYIRILALEKSRIINKVTLFQAYFIVLIHYHQLGQKINM